MEICNEFKKLAFISRNKFEEYSQDKLYCIGDLDGQLRDCR